MFKTPSITIGSKIFRPAVVNVQSGLTPLKCSSPMDKTKITAELAVIGHCVYAVAGDIVHTGVAPKRFTEDRPGWRALQSETLNPKNGKPLGSRIYLTHDLPAGWTHIRITAVNKHSWEERDVEGVSIIRFFNEYRGEAESSSESYALYYREAYLSDLGATKGGLSKDFLAELDFIFDEEGVRKKLAREAAGVLV